MSRQGTDKRLLRLPHREVLLGVLAGLLMATVFATQLGTTAVADHGHCDTDRSGSKFDHGLGDGADADDYVHPFITGPSSNCPQPDDAPPFGRMRANIELRRADGRFSGGYFLVASADCRDCKHLDIDRQTNFPECRYGWYGSGFASLGGGFTTELYSHTHVHHAFCGKVAR